MGLRDSGSATSVSWLNLPVPTKRVAVSNYSLSVMSTCTVTDSKGSVVVPRYLYVDGVQGLPVAFSPPAIHTDGAVRGRFHDDCQRSGMVSVAAPLPFASSMRAQPTHTGVGTHPPKATTIRPSWAFVARDAVLEVAQ